MRGAAALAALILVLVSAILSGTETGDAVSFRLHANGDIEVPVTVGRRGPFRFLVDTGSSRSALFSHTARRLGRYPVAQTMMVTPSGRVVRPMTHLEGVALGTMPPVTVLAMILPEDQSGHTAIDGLIGQDVLAGLTYTIDYDRRQLIFHSAAETAASAIRLPLDWKDGRVLVSLSQRSGAHGPLELIPDSGASELVLFARSDRVLPPVTPLDAAVLRTLSGQRLVRRVLIDELHVGDIRLQSLAAMLVDALPDASLGDGLLPLHLFARVTFNGPGRYLVVEAR